MPVIGNVRLDSITPKHVHAVKRALADRKPKTVNNVLVVLKAMIRVAIDLGILKTSPCQISMLGVPKQEMAFYTDEEFERVVAAADSADARLVVLLGGEAGLRCGEMIALKWTDIDFQPRQISGGPVRLGGRSHGYERRSRALRRVNRAARGSPQGPSTPSWAASAVSRGRHADDTEGDSLPGGPCIEARRGEQAWRPYPAPHVLFTLAMKNAPLKSIQELAGHADLSTTMRYMHLSPVSRAGAIKLLERGNNGEAGISATASG